MKKLMVVLGLVLIASMVLTACQPVVQTVEVEVVRTEVVEQTQIVEQTQVVEVEVEKGAFTTPHPLLSDVRVRQALAYCTNKAELAQAVYPLLSPEQQAELVAHSFIPRTHWAYAGDENLTIYEFSPEKAGALLDEAGWPLDEDAGFRYNEAGEELAFKLTTTNRASRQTWSAVWENQMANCGVRILRSLTPATWFFGENTGVSRRDFELGAWAWVGQPDPGGQTLYACDQINLPENGWEGQNGMGWCNEAASTNIKKANNTLLKEERVAAYTIVQQEFTKDVPSIPLFSAPEAYAYNPNLVGFDPRAPEEYYTYNVNEWELPGNDTIVLSTTQEPATLYDIAIAQWSARMVLTLIGGKSYSGLDYDFQPILMKELPTLESGKAQNNDLEVKEGDMVFDSAGEKVELTTGVKVLDATGTEVEFTGTPIQMKQLVVTYEWLDGIKYSDGESMKAADFELGYKQFCDPESGNVTFITCDRTAGMEFMDNGYTVTYVPGVQDPTYFLPPYGWYASHRVIETDGPYQGKTLADVPAKDWASLPEIAENPIDVGPYVLKEWVKGEKMVFEANPNFILGEPKTKNLVVSIITPENAEAQLIAGQVDMLGSETLVGLTEILAQAEAEGKVKTQIVPGGTWEHIDINLFLR